FNSQQIAGFYTLSLHDALPICGLTRPGPGSWVPNCRPEYLSQCVDKSLKRLKLERIDVYQLHTVDRKVPIEESVGALKAAQDARSEEHTSELQSPDQLVCRLLL